MTCALAALWNVLPASATAQQPVIPVQSVPALADAERTDEIDRNRPSSTETVHSPLDESFGPRSRADWLVETRRKAWEDTRFDIQLRSYYLDREKLDQSQSEAWALGGWIGLKTGYFRERFAFGATGYTSQRLYGPEDKDGTTLLQPGQHGYTVLGELYGEFLITQGTRLGIGRRGIDTPFLNRNDGRMTPNTFEAITVQGLYGGGGGQGEWRAGGGYFDRMKQRNSDEFASMATVAGAPDGVDRGVFAGGANFRKGGLSIGAIDYYSKDIINIFHAEAKYAIKLRDHTRLQFGLQYSGQASTGDQLLLGREFTAEAWGGKAEIGIGGALFTTAYTRTGGSIGMQNPWSSYPGYTSVQVESFNRGGERAWMLRAAYEFESVEGLGVYGLWVDGSDPRQPGQYAKQEYDVNLQWKPASGTFAGLMLRLRYAHVSSADPVDSDLDELRVMLYFAPPSR